MRNYLDTLKTTLQYEPNHCDIVNNPMSALAPIAEVLSKLILMLRNITFALAILFIVIGGISLITSQGDPEKLNKGKSTIVWAVVAIIIAYFLWFAILILANYFGLKGFENNSIPFTVPKFEFTPVTC